MGVNVREWSLLKKQTNETHIVGVNSGRIRR